MDYKSNLKPTKKCVNIFLEINQITKYFLPGKCEVETMEEG